MRNRIITALLACAALIGEASAQNAIPQEGTVLQNSPMMFRGNNRARQDAGENGAPSGQMIGGGEAIVSKICAFINTTDKPPISELCFNPQGTVDLNDVPFPVATAPVDGNVFAPS